MQRSSNRIVSGLALFALVLAGTVAAAETGSFGFKRKINPEWFPDDPRQWSQYARSLVITDLAQVKEQDGLTTGRREKGKWKVLPYEIGKVKGRALSAYYSTNPPSVKLQLGQRGWYAVYVGLSTVSGGIVQAQSSGIMARLDREPVFRRMKNNMRLTSIRGDVVQEILLSVANLDPSDSLEIKPFPNLPATIMYVRLVPLGDSERLAWEADGNDVARRTAIATFDGHSWIWPYQPRTAADLQGVFRGFERTDYSQWWFGITGADLVVYPSKVGTIPGATTKDFPTAAHEEFTHSVLQLIENGVNPLLVAREAARAQGREFHVFIRPQAWGASIPFEETFDSKFFQDHPEWRCVDREGRRTLHMSWAVPEVRQHVLAVFREAVEMSDPEGVGIFFNRGMPLMLWEKAFADRFQEEYRLDIMKVDAEDKRIHALRGKIMTDFMAELRSMLDQIGAAKGGRRYKISASTLAAERFNTRFGLDPKTWAAKGCVDQLSVMAAYHTAIPGQAYAPPDMAYYRRVVAGSNVKVFPYVVAWSTKLWSEPNPKGLCRLVLQWYKEGADGITVWDPHPESGYGDNAHQGQPFDLLAYLNHRELLAYWAEHGVPLPANRLVTRLGENEYSPWYPNVGY